MATKNSASPLEIRRSAITIVTRIIILEITFMLLILGFHITNGAYAYYVGSRLFSYVFIGTQVFFVSILFRLLFMAKIIYDWLYTYWVIDHDKITFHTGAIRKKTEEYTISTVESTSVTQSIYGRMLNYGTV